MLIFAPPPSGARTQSQRHDPGLCYNIGNIQQEQSQNDAVVASISVLVNDEQGQQNVSSGHKSAAQHGPDREQFSPNESGVDHNGLSDKEAE